MTIEPSDNPHLVIGKLMHENMALKSTLKVLREEYDEAQKHHTRRYHECIEYEKQIKALNEQVETHEKTIGILNAQLDGCREANQILSNKNKELEKLLKEERDAYFHLKFLRHVPKRTLPNWSVEFSTKYNGDIIVLFNNMPSLEHIDKMKERLDATHWNIAYKGFTCND